ncbi:hypothetical protein P170DRAFT_512763 [Aspergillus steynii IBT 23096]|uniref:Uncharacterized protein n=1 Tax=Aspergillus steynii IBT 23096 TaxID=1392250 RepID=A0A2I2G063_9EURO|nr:uncharacterized protein P170DRAFT_512763 [Aspergillus steynii IBT 23096]PLB46216.1 hypothetical protein P170DRAFT_512763 [Aspergillus steynii IBT 23096]
MEIISDVSFDLRQEVLDLKQELAELRDAFLQCRSDNCDTSRLQDLEHGMEHSNLNADMAFGFSDTAAAISIQLNKEMSALLQIVGSLDKRVSRMEAKFLAQEQAMTRLNELYINQQAQIERLTSDATWFGAISEHFIQAREIYWDSKLRELDSGLSTGENTPPASHLSSNTQAEVVLDARLCMDRRSLMDRDRFRQLYGLSPEQVEALASQRCVNTLRIVNTVAGLRLSNCELKPGEYDIFNRITQLVNLYDDYSAVEARSVELLANVNETKK